MEEKREEAPVHSIHALSDRAEELRFELSDQLLALARVIAGGSASHARDAARALRVLLARAREPARVSPWLRPAAFALWGTAALVLHVLVLEIAMVGDGAGRLDRRLRVLLHERSRARP